MSLHIRLLLVPSLAAAAFAATAGTVNVSFVNPSSYWDAGSSSWDEAANLTTLATHLQKLGQRSLPADHALTIEVLQVDLAGTVRAFQRDGSAVRVITGGADWPRINLRYTLQAGGRTVASGTEWVADTDYTHGLAARGDNQPLFYEKRMLNAWFKARFVDALAGPG